MILVQLTFEQLGALGDQPSLEWKIHLLLCIHGSASAEWCSTIVFTIERIRIEVDLCQSNPCCSRVTVFCLQLI